MSRPPGPSSRLGMLVPSSNSNAESLTADILAGSPDVGVHYSRFRLPADLDDRIDAKVLGDAPSLLNDAGLDAIAFHGTSGSWTGLEGDRALAESLTEATGAPATTASLALVAALEAVDAGRVAVVFPGPPSIMALIEREYAASGLEVVRSSAPATSMSNPEISRMSGADIGALMRPAFGSDVDAVVCIGTNLRSAYLAAGFESEFGVPVVDSATATLWHLLRLAGTARPIPGWGALLARA